MEYGLDTKQFRLHIVRPILQKLDLWQPAAENLVVGTCLHESHLKYVKQLGGGPALGFGQMEPVTHDDLWVNFIRYKAGLAHDLRYVAGGDPLIPHPIAQTMIWNAGYAVAMTRAHYLRVKAGLPPADNARALSQYWKSFYNTKLGKGTVEQALPHFELAVKEGVL